MPSASDVFLSVVAEGRAVVADVTQIVVVAVDLFGIGDHHLVSHASPMVSPSMSLWSELMTTPQLSQRLPAVVVVVVLVGVVLCDAVVPSRGDLVVVLVGVAAVARRPRRTES
jgi:hypothetical protein